MLYQLSVGCLFKNESHAMKEWLEHYILHGVDHFYLINDDSNDDCQSILQPSIDAGRVTLFNTRWHQYLGRQRDMYNHYILPRLPETQWLLMVDMDEFVYSRQHVDLKMILQHCLHLGQIQIYDVLFGSNGHITQPTSIIKGFTMRERQPRNYLKYFVNCDFQFTSLNVHHATFANKEDELHKFIQLGHDDFTINHYCCQSLDFWQTIKMTRGDSDFYRARTLEDFHLVDKNEVEDLTLMLQNK